MMCRQTSDEGQVRTLPLYGLHQRDSYSCGFVSTLMVLNYFYPNEIQTGLYEGLGTNEEGTSQNAIIRQLRRRQVSVNTDYAFTHRRLRRAIDKGKLVIGYRHKEEHWIVLYGYGLEPERVFIANPEPYSYTICSWAKISQDLGGFGIICSRRMKR